MRIWLPRALGTVVVVFLASAGGPSSVANAKTQPSVLPLLESYRGESRSSELETTVPELHETFLGSKTSPEERRFASLALGVHYLGSNHRLALQYLSSAEMTTRNRDHLLPIIRYHMARARFRAEAFAEAAQEAENVLAHMESGEWADRVFDLAIKSWHRAARHDKVIETYESFQRRFSDRRLRESHMRWAALAYHHEGDFTHHVRSLETLAKGYPTSKDSRWAFRELVELNCRTEDGDPKYRFSKSLLAKLSRNANVGVGLREFIAAAAHAPIRVSEDSVRTMDGEERLEFFFRSRLYETAREQGEALLRKYRRLDDQEKVADTMYRLGRTYARLKQPKTAARQFARFLAEFPEHRRAPRVHEYLGDSYKYMGRHGAAADQYKIALQHRSSRYLRWNYFWQTYRSERYEKTLSLLRKPGYVVSRDRRYSESLDFWEARVLHKLGRAGEARRGFSRLLQREAGGFYGNVTAARLEAPVISSQPEDGDDLSAAGDGGMIRLASAEASPTREQTSAASLQPELQMVDDLLRVGLKDSAKTQLASLSWRGLGREDSFMAVSRLAWLLDDYRPSRRIKSRSFSALRSVPSERKKLVAHQRKHTEDWKLYYPLAFEEIVADVHDAVGIDKHLILSVMRSESFYNKSARSWVGARGLMQIMPYTGLKIARMLDDENFSLSDLERPEVNISYGGYYLNHLIQYYGGNPYVAVAAYNAGPRHVNSWLKACRRCTADEFVENIPFRETRRYVRKVMKTYAHYKRIYEDPKFSLPMPQVPRQLPEDMTVF